MFRIFKPIHFQCIHIKAKAFSRSVVRYRPVLQNMDMNLIVFALRDKAHFVYMRVCLYKSEFQQHFSQSCCFCPLAQGNR